MNEIIKENVFSVYEKNINISLFNEIIAFIAYTRNSKGTNDILYEIQEKCIWYDIVNGLNLQEKYNFEYLGELLERYEERLGNKIEDIRAMALALGYGKKLIESNMIIGTQLIDFLSKIKNLAQEDIYLQGALYLYDNEKYNLYFNQLMNRKYDKTEDIVFILSVFYDTKEAIFKNHRDNIVSLLGKQKSISVIGNIGVYAWIIRTLYVLINNDRKKDISLLKALIKIPTGFQKEDTNIYRELIQNGYSKKEIAYLNYLILSFNTVPKAIALENSIVAEKIAVNFCEVFINSKDIHDKSIYNVIKNILLKYRTFDIKCYGCQTIKKALYKKINIVNPITFAELYGEFNNELFSFDILDKKWDIVASECEEDTYEKIIDNFIYVKVDSKEKIKKCIEKYNSLTGKNYIESFYKRKYGRQDIFDKLVDKNVIILKDIFKHIEKEKSFESNHLDTYIREIRRKPALDFLKYLIRSHQYTFEQIDKMGFEISNLLDTYHYSGAELNIDRKFLNNKDKRFLFNCLEQFIFYEKPTKYFDFLEATLKYKNVEKILPKNEIVEIYKQLCEIDPETYKKESLQEKFLSTEEMEEIRKQKVMEKEYKRVQEIIEQEHELDEKFKSIDKNDFKNLCNLCDRWYISVEKQLVMKMVKEYLYMNIMNFNIDNTQMVYLMKLLQFFLENNEMTINEVMQILNKYIGGKVNEYKFNETCKVNY